MNAHFHPDGTAQLEYCVKCERAALERLQQFQCLSGVAVFPGLHRECQTTVKRELQSKMSATWKAYANAIYGPIGSPLSNVVKATTGIDL
jgi:hypothetical protein